MASLNPGCKCKVSDRTPETAQVHHIFVYFCACISYAPKRKRCLVDLDSTTLLLHITFIVNVQTNRLLLSISVTIIPTQCHNVYPPIYLQNLTVQYEYYMLFLEIQGLSCIASFVINENLLVLTFQSHFDIFR